MKLVTSAVAALVAPGKGVLAAGEGVAAMSARLTSAGVSATPGNRRAYREMLITTGPPRTWPPCSTSRTCGR